MDWDDDDGFIACMTAEIATCGSYKSGCEFDTVGGNDPFNGRDSYRSFFEKHCRDDAVVDDGADESANIVVRYQARAAAQQSEWEQEQAEKQRQKQAAADREWEAEGARRADLVTFPGRMSLRNSSGTDCGRVIFNPVGKVLFYVSRDLWNAHKPIQDSMGLWHDNLDCISGVLADAGLKVA